MNLSKELIKLKHWVLFDSGIDHSSSNTWTMHGIFCMPCFYRKVPAYYSSRLGFIGTILTICIPTIILISIAIEHHHSLIMMVQNSQRNISFFSSG